MNPTKLVEMLLQEGKRPEDSWIVTVQRADPPIPGYIQIDTVDQFGNERSSTSPEKLSAEGYALPPFDDLETGRYLMGDILAGRAEPLPRFV